MTLSARLALTPGVQLVLIWGERLSWGRGYLVHVRPCPVEGGLSKDPLIAATQINQAMEALVRECPAQYIWSYDRYKQPQGSAAATTELGRRCLIDRAAPHELHADDTTETTAAPALQHQLELADWLLAVHARTGLCCPCPGCVAWAGWWDTCCICSPASAAASRGPTGPCVFPQQSEAERRQAVRQHFVVFAQSWLDRGWIWGAERSHWCARASSWSAIWRRCPTRARWPFLRPHFVGLDAGGAALSLAFSRNFISLYARQRNVAIDQWVRAGRLKYGSVRLVEKHESLRTLVQALRSGEALYLLPDMDLGPTDSVVCAVFWRPSGHGAHPAPPGATGTRPRGAGDQPNHARGLRSHGFAGLDRLPDGRCRLPIPRS